VFMSGPAGNVINWAFDPPAGSTRTSLAEMPVGDYSARVVNAAGNTTAASFNIASLSIEVSTPGSRETFTATEPFLFDAAALRLNVRAEGSNDLEHVEFRGADGVLIGSRPVSGQAGEALFTLPAVPLSAPLFSLFNFPIVQISYPYTVDAYDKKGNKRRSTGGLAMAYDLFAETVTPYASDSQEFKGEITDLYSAGFITGALLSNYTVQDSIVYKHTAGCSAHAVPAGAGGLTSTKHLGSITAKVYTGDAPDLSDAVESQVAAAEPVG